MTEGPIGQKLIRFALPLFWGNLFQQLYNIADTLIVGNLLGSTALAAVSSTGSLIFLLVSLFSGVSMGAGVVIARYFGARDVPRMRRAVHTALAFGLATGAVVTAVGVLLSPQVLTWMDTPAEVMAQSVAYLRVYFAGALGMVLYNTCMSILQAVGDSRHPLEYLILSSCLNVVLDLVMIAAFHWGVAGAALATILAQFVSMILCLIRLTRVKADYRVSWRELRFHGAELKLIVRYGLPSGLQNSIISLANVVVQSNINAFGEMAMAGCGAYSKVEGFGFLPVTSFTMALTTFVSQNLGAREYDRARRGARLGILSAMLLAEAIGVALVAFAPALIRAFTDQPAAIAFGVDRARVAGLFYCLMAYNHCVSAVLRGAGRAVTPMVVMLVFWCVVRVSFLAVVGPLVQSMAAVNWVYPLTWSLSSVVLLIYYHRADWLHGFERRSAAGAQDSAS